MGPIISIGIMELVSFVKNKYNFKVYKMKASKGVLWIEKK